MSGYELLKEFLHEYALNERDFRSTIVNEKLPHPQKELTLNDPNGGQVKVAMKGNPESHVVVLSIDGNKVMLDASGAKQLGELLRQFGMFVGK